MSSAKEQPTPLRRLCPNVYAKLEWHNPAGSSKYRPARNMILTSLTRGALRPGQTVVESSSGNLGLALAHVCREQGLNFHCVVDPNTPEYTLKALRRYGTRLSRVDRPDRQTGSFLVARRALARQLQQQNQADYYWPDQYSNPHNPGAQQDTIKELREQLGGLPDYLICAVGSWGTAVGCAQALAHLGSTCKLIAVDGMAHGNLWVPGLGYGRRPDFPNFKMSLITKIISVTPSRAIQGCRRLWERHQIDVGGSSGAVWSAYRKLNLDPAARVVLLLADDGRKYRQLVWGRSEVPDTRAS